MQTLVNFESASSFEKGTIRVGMRFLPKILDKLKDYPESVQFAVIHLLYFAFFTSMVTAIVIGICTIICHR